MGRFGFLFLWWFFWSCPLVGFFRWTSPIKFQECREIAQENFVGGKWKALFWVGCVVSEQRRKKMSSWKIQRNCQNTTFFWGLSTMATEILCWSCWGAIWLVFERWAKELQGDRELWLQALWEWFGVAEELQDGWLVMIFELRIRKKRWGRKIAGRNFQRFSWKYWFGVGKQRTDRVWRAPFILRDIQLVPVVVIPNSVKVKL